MIERNKTRKGLESQLNGGQILQRLSGINLQVLNSKLLISVEMSKIQPTKG